MRAAVEQGRPQALGRADGDVRPQLPGRGQERGGQRVHVHGHQAAARVDGLDQGSQVVQGAAGGGLRQHDPGQGVVGDAHHRVVEHAGEVGEDDRQVQLVGPGHGHLDALGVQVQIQQDREILALTSLGAHHQHHGLGHGGGLVQQGGAGHGQAGEVADHRLEQ